MARYVWGTNNLEETAMKKLALALALGLLGLPLWRRTDSRPQDLDMAAARPSAGTGDQGMAAESRSPNGTIKTAIFPSEQLVGVRHYDNGARRHRPI